MPYRPRKNSVPLQAIAHLRALPAGTRMSEADLAVAVRERAAEVRQRLGRAIKAGYVALDETGYSAGANAHEAFVDSPSPPKPSKRYSASEETSRESRAHRGSLRELVSSGMSLDVGNPLRELADMMDAARDVMVKKPTSRYATAEVDVVVAREIRCVLDTVSQATANLKKMLEIM